MRRDGGDLSIGGEGRANRSLNGFTTEAQRDGGALQLRLVL